MVRDSFSLKNHNGLNPAALQIYSNAIAADKGAALHHYFGFVDGTV